jgi:glycine oxidase
VPDIAELELAEATARLRPGSPDNGPLLGPATTAGLVVATGHFRHGILLTPVTVDAIGEVLAGRDVTGPAAAFSPQRFVLEVPAYG